jgi:copper(I)-binding protein
VLRRLAPGARSQEPEAEAVLTVRSIAILFAVTWLAGIASAQPADIVVREAWIREAEPQSSSAAYFVLENRGTAPVRLVAAEVDGAGMVEIHEMTMAGDMMRMTKLNGVDVPAGGTVVFRPGGLHLMLFQLRRAFRPGTAAAVTLRFANGSSVKAQAGIRKKSVTGA